MAKKPQRSEHALRRLLQPKRAALIRVMEQADRRAASLHRRGDLNLTTGEYFGLDAVGAQIWRLMTTAEVPA